MKKFLLFILLLFLILFDAFTYAHSIQNEIASNVVRLHIIANSNSVDDQNLKLKVRDNLLQYMNTISSDCSTKEEAISIANMHKEDFYKIAKQTISDNGYDYDVKINIGNFYFPTKNYGDISLPAGMYDALRVEIGEAKGKNWWCVMFPSLCFIDVSSGIVDDNAKESLQENLNTESYNIISKSNDSKLEFKFKIIEFFAEKGLFTAKN